MDSMGHVFSAGQEAEQPVGQHERKRKRDSLFLLARLSIDGGDQHEVRVRNLSEGGLMAEVERPLAIGTSVEVDLRGIGRVPGKVAWWAEGRAGVALDYAIDPRKARKPVSAPKSAASGSGSYRR